MKIQTAAELEMDADARFDREIGQFDFDRGASLVFLQDRGDEGEGLFVEFHGAGLDQNFAGLFLLDGVEGEDFLRLERWFFAHLVDHAFKK